MEPTLMPGDYCIPFSFYLPPGLPSSLLFKPHHHTKKPKAKIKYHVKAYLRSSACPMKYKQIMTVQEAPG